MQANEKVAILVKALPQPSKTYGETVCCAGVTATGGWKRLFPVRFRHLKGEHSFGRWDWVSFRHGQPKSDRRVESCHVHEESIAINGKLPERDRSSLLEPLILGSGEEAGKLGHSLALVRPRNTRFVVRRKSSADIADDRAAYARAAQQIGMFDAELAALDPSPFEFRFRFEDEAGKHDYQNGDWEAHAMFWRECKRTSEAEALRWMDGIFNDEYPRKGMVFAIGNQAKRPQTWQLLGVIRLDAPTQTGFAF